MSPHQALPRGRCEHRGSAAIRRPFASRARTAALAALLVAIPGGCGGKASPFRADAAAGAPRSTAMPGALQHVVLVELNDKKDLAAMKADSDAMLPTIPSVRGYVCGTPVDIGRATVAKDYDLGIVVQFASVDDYRAYLEHPVHQQLVSKWRPRWRRSYIVDFAP